MANEKGPAQSGLDLSLPCFEAAIRLIDHVNPPLTAHHATIPVPLLEGFERATHFHIAGSSQSKSAAHNRNGAEIRRGP